jgi:hypothetical protein
MGRHLKLSADAQSFDRVIRCFQSIFNELRCLWKIAWFHFRNLFTGVHRKGSDEIQQQV